MGRRQSKRKRHNGGGDGNVWKDYSDAALTNAAYERYYRGTVIPEAEWEQFMTSMRLPLPLALRFNLSLPWADSLRALVMQAMDGAGLGPKAIPFYPREMALQAATASRMDLKHKAENKSLKRLLASLSDIGYLSRQEVVSMIPPLLLDVRPGHKVLDMCAAPGSKTSQLLEALLVSGPTAAGCVVANDRNASRLDVLNHQTTRIPGAQSHLIITSFDAAVFPLVGDTKEKYDRVLCDVMCSCDGTMRKSRDIWEGWTAWTGAALHNQQVRVLTRGMALCKPGGIVVYSTCSLNPIEDEAVVLQAVEQSQGTFRIADTKNELTHLRRYAGMTTWRVANRDATAWFSEVESAVKAMPQKSGFHFSPSMFPPPAADAAISNTMRVPSHLQDTGGFYIAKLECLGDFPNSLVRRQSEVRAAGQEAEVANPATPIPPGMQDLYRAYKPIQASLVEKVAKMGLPADFPVNKLYAPFENARQPKLYVLEAAAAEVLATLPPTRVMQAGAKVFDSATKHSFEHLRISPEGTSCLVPLVPSDWILQCSAKGLQGISVRPQQEIPLTEFISLLDAPREASSIPKNFLVRCPLAAGAEYDGKLGVLHCAGSVHDEQKVVRIRFTDAQVSLLRLSVGLPLVTPDAEDDDSDAGDEEEKEEQKPEQSAASPNQETAASPA